MKYYILGVLTIKENEALSKVMKSDKGSALLAYLIITRESQPRDKVADLIWDATSTEKALQNLRQLLSSTLRNEVAELQIERKSLIFKPTKETFVDLYELEEALKSVDPIQLEAGLQLYKGDLLAGLYLPDAQRFNEWLAIAQERLRQRVYAAYRRLCEVYTQKQQWNELITVTRRWLGLDDLLEEAHFWLIQALKETGQWQAALGQYQNYVQIMEDEFNLLPSPHMVALFEEITISRLHSLPTAVAKAELPEQSRPLESPIGYQWGEAPRTDQFYGRQTELDTLTQWLMKTQAHLVTILGIGGQGKTALAAVVARSLADQFDGVFWRSVINAPPIQGVLFDYLNYLSGNQQLVTNSIEEQLAAIRKYLQTGRHLLILDNIETILDAQHTGHFQERYKAYEQILHLFGQGGHQSCLLLTSREAPTVLTRLAQQSDHVYQLRLSGLSLQDSSSILKATELRVTTNTSAVLTKRYSGNPLALKLVAQAIQEFYFGDVNNFLNQETIIFDDIHAVLDQQFQRLSDFEQEILLWLAITREATMPQQLSELIIEHPHQRSLLETMKRLQKRSLLERQTGGFTIQNVITEYLTDFLIHQVYEELTTGNLKYLRSHALLLAQTKEHIRQSQKHLILRPIAEQLSIHFGLQRLDQLFRQLLEQLRQGSQTSGYAAGNILNLLLFLKIDMANYNFSNLQVWQADLKGQWLPTVNFSGADLSYSTFTDVFDSIYTVAFSPDGSLLAAGASNGVVRLLNAATGQSVTLLRGHNDAVWSVAFSPNGRILASGGIEGIIILWDTILGEQINVLTGHQAGVHGLDFSPDGQTMASSSTDKTIRLWDVASGQTKSILSGHNANVQSVAFSPNGRLLASGGRDHKLSLWRLTDSQTPADEKATAALSWEAHTDWIYAVAFSPDGHILVSCGEDNHIKLWDVPAILQHQTDPKPRQILTEHTAGVQSVSFSPDGGLFATGSGDKTVRLWHTTTGQPLQILQEHSNWVRAVAFSPDGHTLVSAGWDETVRFWKADLSGWYSWHTIEGYSNLALGIDFSPDNKLLVSGHTNELIHVWEVSSGQLLHTLNGHQNWVYHVAFSPDSKALASSSFDHTIRLWDTQTWQLQQVLKGHQDYVQGIDFSPNGDLLASASIDRTIHLWEIPSGKVKQVLYGHSSWVNDVAFNPNGQLLASSSADATIILWDVGSGQIRHTLKGHNSGIQNIAFSPDGRLLATAGWDSTIRLWDVETGVVQQVLEGHTNFNQGVAFSPNGETLASCGYDQTVRLWEVKTGRLLHILHGHNSRVLFTTFTSDGSILASSANKSIKLWNPYTGECLQSWQAPGPYKGMVIDGVTGITEAERLALKTLGAVE